MIEQMGTAITTINGARELVKNLISIKSITENAEAKLRVAELIELLANVKTDLADIKMVIVDKDALIKELQEQLKVKNSLVFEEPFYWLVDVDKKDGPYCQRCYDVDCKLIRLCKKEGYMAGSHQCLECQNWYGQGEELDSSDFETTYNNGFI